MAVINKHVMSLNPDLQFSSFGLLGIFSRQNCVKSHLKRMLFTFCRHLFAKVMSVWKIALCEQVDPRTGQDV